LTAIVDLEVAERAGWRPADLAAAYLSGGATFLQVRAKRASGAEFVDLAATIVELARPGGAVVVVNDRADIARIARADGVHVGQTDLPPADVRQIVGGDAVVGLSTHTLEQMNAAVREPVTYVAIGPVFGTTSKATGYDAVGLDMVRSAAASAKSRGLPLVAIGGITLATARSVIDAGATSVAIIGDLLSTGNPEARIREFLQRIAS